MRRTLSVLFLSAFLATGGAWAAGGDASVGLGITPSFTGDVNVGIVLVHFDDTPPERWFDAADEADIVNAMFGLAPGSSANDLYREMSNDVDGFHGDLVGTFDIGALGHDGAPCDLSTPFGDWNDQALAEIAEAQISLAGYEILVFVYPKTNICDGPVAGVNGIAFPTTGTDPLPAIAIYNWKTSIGPSIQAFAHELGHLRGWGHSGTPTEPGVNNDYKDLSCVMADNYDYAVIPAAPVPVRQANAPWKWEAEYIRDDEVVTLDAPGTYTVYLAPSEQHHTDFPTPPQGVELKHIARVQTTSYAPEYWVSFRHPAGSNFDNDPALAALMGRIYVHTAKGFFTRRHAILDAGPDDTFDGENVTVVAKTDGLDGATYPGWVEVEITVSDNVAPRVTISPSTIVENNQSAGPAGPFSIDVFNGDDAMQAPATFDITVTADPGVDTVTVTPNPLTVAPGSTASAALDFGFSSPPEERSYEFAIAVSDPSGVRDDPAEVSATYTNDLTAPDPPANLGGQHNGSSIFLSWSWVPGATRYDVRRDGADIITPPWFLGFSWTDNDVNPGEPHSYEVRAIDAAGNEGDWSAPVNVTDPCNNGFTAALTPATFATNQAPDFSGPAATFDLEIHNSNPAACGSYTYATSGTDSSADYYLSGIPDPSIVGGASGNAAVALSWAPDGWQPPNPPPPPEDGFVNVTVTVTEPNGNAQNVNATYVLDRADPGAVGNLAATLSAGAVDLSWTAATDPLSGIGHYEVSREGAAPTVVAGTTFQDANPGCSYEVVAVDNAGNRSAAVAVNVPSPIASVALTPDGVQTAQSSIQFTVQATTEAVLCGGTYAVTTLTDPGETIALPTEITIAAGQTAFLTGFLTSTVDGTHLLQVDVGGEMAAVPYTVDTAPPTIPGTLSYSVSGGDVTLDWGAASDATTGVVGYQVYRGSTLIQTVPGLTYTDTSAPSTRPLTYKVRALDFVGNTGPFITVTLPKPSGCKKCPDPHQQ